MLNALITLATAGVSEAGSFDIAGINAVHLHAANPLMTPEEPTTLTLALIGAGLIAGYAAVRRMRRQQPVIAAFPTVGKHGAAAKQKRGAA